MIYAPRGLWLHVDEISADDYFSPKVKRADELLMQAFRESNELWIYETSLDGKVSFFKNVAVGCEYMAPSSIVIKSNAARGLPVLWLHF